jgi:hypothetical protein
VSLAQKSSIPFFLSRKYDVIIWAGIRECRQDGIFLSQRVSHTFTLPDINAMETKSFLMNYPDEYRVDDQQLSMHGTLVNIFFLSCRLYGFLSLLFFFFRRFRFPMREGRGEERLVPC